MSEIETRRGRNSSFFTIALGLLSILGGCSGGSLTIREKGVGIGALGAQQLAGLLALPLVISALALPFAEGLFRVPAL